VLQVYEYDLSLKYMRVCRTHTEALPLEARINTPDNPHFQKTPALDYGLAALYARVYLAFLGIFRGRFYKVFNTTLIVIAIKALKGSDPLTN